MEELVTKMLQAIGEDVSREGLLDTPARVIRSWKEIYKGYGMSLKSFKTSFSKEKYDQMIVAKDITFYSTCEHHMLPFFGKAHVAYICDKKLLGLSKLSRIVDMFSRRLQIQERMTDQIADAIVELCTPKGVGVIIEGQHLCCMSRGVQQPNKVMITSALRGNFQEQKVKEEFLAYTR